MAYQAGKQAREVKARRQRIYDFICASWQENGYAPSQKEIADAVELGTTAVNRHLQVLRARGCIDWEPDTPRTIRITGEC